MTLMWKLLGLVATGSLLAGCSSEHRATQFASGSSVTADMIVTGDNIITMDGSTPEAVAVAGEKIIATGSRADVMNMRSAKTRIVELGERALLPGFIDAHGHIALQARFIDMQNVSSPPVGDAKTIADIQRLLRDYIARNNFPAGTPVIGYGYDESLLAEKRHPVRQELDVVSARHPIVLLHVSLHLASVNSAALAISGYDEKTPDPSGGIIRRETGTQTPNGVLEETAAQRIMFGLIANPPGLEDKMHRAMLHYASYGYTTAQDGAATMEDVAVMREAAAKKQLPIDVISYPLALRLTPEQKKTIRSEPYVGGFRVAGVKHVLDGSIQGKTGFLGLPYVEPPKGGKADYRGYPMISAKLYQDNLTPYIQRAVPMLIHSNGDAAIDMMLNGLEKALEGTEIKDHRAVIIHAQMMREDQLDRTRKLGAIPSYFSAHPFYWGDWHRKILGEERASRISPIRSTINKGIAFTIHNDAPVVPPDAMRLIWATVNRETRSGYVLGPKQKASVMEALYATTMGAAYQAFEEDSKGSITVGKQADLVILEKNPLTVDPGAIDDIKILETISRGRSVYKSAEFDAPALMKNAR